MAESKNVTTLVDAAIGRSESRRSKVFSREKDRFESRALSSGAYSMGRDENGLLISSIALPALGVTVNGWRVKMPFKRDDRHKLREMSWRDVESAVKNGTSPVQIVVTENHILIAVRELKHVLEGYKREVAAKLDNDLSPIAEMLRLNMAIHLRGKDATDEEIESLIKSLEYLRKDLGKKRDAIKSVVGYGRLDDSIAKFKDALEDRPRRGFLIGRACPVLLSASERLTSWRDEKIARAVSKSTARISSLRVERDKWLFSQLANYSNNTARFQRYIEIDEKKKDLLKKVDALIDEITQRQRRMTKYDRMPRWTDEDESRLVSETAAFETMKAEAMTHPWFASGGTADLRKTIKSIKKKRNKTPEDEERLSKAQKELERLEKEAKESPWAARAAQVESLAKLRGRKKRAEENAALLKEATQAYNEKSVEALRCLWANWSLFYSAATKPAELHGDYGWIHRHIKEDEPLRSRAKISELLVFLDSNKPRFVYDELMKSPEPYLQGILKELGLAVTAFEAKETAIAQRHFAFAALEMRAIVYPERG